MSLILHAGAEAVDAEALRSLPTPEPTATHVPIPHHFMVDVVKHMLAFYGHEVLEEHHATTKDGNRYFGALTLRSYYGDYTDMVGLRNSHDKSFPVGLAFGSRVFVCDNLAFVAEHVVKRKHTAKARHELPSLISQLVEPLSVVREKQHNTLTLYKNTRITDDQAYAAMMKMYRQNIINVTRLPEILEQWEEPAHDWGDKTAYRLFNGATYALTGKVAETPRLTQDLHRIMDAVCV